MAEVKTPKLPDDVAADFKYVGNWQTRFVLPKHNNLKVNVETLTPKTAEAIVGNVSFLKRKQKRTPKTDKK